MPSLRLPPPPDNWFQRGVAVYCENVVLLAEPRSLVAISRKSGCYLLEIMSASSSSDVIVPGQSRLPAGHEADSDTVGPVLIHLTGFSSDVAWFVMNLAVHERQTPCGEIEFRGPPLSLRSCSGIGPLSQLPLLASTFDIA